MTQTIHKPHRDVKPEKGIQDQGPEDASALVPATDPKYQQKGIDPERIKALRVVNGLTHKDIGGLLNCSESTVRYHLRNMGIASRKELEDFKVNRADLLAMKQSEMIHSLTDDKTQKASLRDLIWSFGVLYDKERLERGQSTGNIALSIDDMSIADQAALRKLADKLPEMILESEPVKEGTR